MPALSTAERTAFDNTIYPAVGYVYISEPELVFEAPLNGVQYSKDAIVALSYGTATTGDYTLIEPEMTCEIWANSANLHGSQRIRLAATTSAIFVGRSPEGTRPGELSYVSGATIRVYKERRAWSKNPYIDPNNGNQYKDELVYPGDDDAQPPVANAGADVLVIVDTSADTADIDLDALGDIASFVTRSGASLSTYLWDLDDGTAISGTVNDSSLTARFGVGERYVALTVTDDNGATHTAYKWVVVATRADCIPARIVRESIRPSGVTLSLEVDSDQLPAASRPNSKMIYGIDTTHGATGSKQLLFSGWIATEQRSIESRKQKRKTTIECHDIATRLRSLYGFPLSVSNQSSETGWYRMPDATIDRLTHHYLQWHSNVLALTDFSWSGQGGTYPLPEFTTTGASLWEQASRLARAIGYALTCNTAGQLRIVGDPILLPTANQATDYSLPTQRTSTVVTTLTEADFTEPSFTGNQGTQYYWVRYSAVVASAVVGDIDAVKCSAPGKTPAQGTSSVEETEFLVTSQGELNVRAGNDYAARKNAFFSAFTFPMIKTKQVFEPADMEWVKVVMPSEDRTRYPFLSGSGNNFLIQEIVNNYDHRKMKRSSTIIAEIEVEGIPAQSVIDPPQATEQFPSYEFDDYFVPVLPDITFFEAETGITPGGSNMMAITNNGRVYVTNDFDTPSWQGGPTWTFYDHSATIGITVLSYAYRAGASNISAWIATPTGIWYAENLQNPSPSFTLQFSYSGTAQFACIDADYINTPGRFAVCVYGINNGAGDRFTYVTETVNGGTTWDAEAALDNQDLQNPMVPSTVYVSAHTAGVAFSPVRYNDGLNDEMQIWRTNNFGDSYSVLSGANIDDGCGVILVPYADRNGRYMYVGSNTGLSTVLGGLVGTETNNLLVFDLNTGSYLANISPTFNGIPYGPVTNTSVSPRFRLAAADNDPSLIAMMGSRYNDVNRGVFVTNNALSTNPTWTVLLEPGSVSYNRLAFGSGGRELYVFGNATSIGYTNTPFVPGSIDSRKGNMTSNSNIIGIAGF